MFKRIEPIKALIIGGNKVENVVATMVNEQGAVAHIVNDDSVYRLFIEKDGAVEQAHDIFVEAVVAMAEHSGMTQKRADFVQVKHIGKRTQQFDPLFDTGYWTKDQVKNVPADKAIKMCGAFRGVFEIVRQRASESVEDVAVIHNKPVVDNEALDFISHQTDVKVLREYVWNNFQQKLDHRMGLAKAKEKAIMLLDQYGLPE